MSVLRRFAVLAVALTGSLVACGGDDGPSAGDRPTVVVTTSILGAVVSEVVGDAADVEVLMANGTDPHEWEASPKDIERLTEADFVVVNGLGLEESLVEAVASVRARGIPVFEAARNVDVIAVEGAEAEEHPDGDPHFWTDGSAMAEVAMALGDALSDAGIDVGDRASVVYEDLLTLDNDVRERAATLDANARKLVTGHESLAYFARSYGFELVGAVVPGLSSEAEVSAGELSDLKRLIESEGVSVIFTEIGTPSQVVGAIADELDARVVEIDTHLLPAEGGYEAFLTGLVSAIVDALAS
ncbi:MAG: metal ABC transporter substrate-binding protein [Actinomycetota bacterium]